jgi:CDP-glycerol glycerophosphotransferase
LDLMRVAPNTDRSPVPRSGRWRRLAGGLRRAAVRRRRMMERRRSNLLHDTVYRRARTTVIATVHAVDDVATGVARSRSRILFEAASPMSLAVFQPVLDRLQHDPRIELWFTTSDRSWNASKLFLPVGIPGRVITSRAARWRKFDAYINADFWNMTWLPRRTERIHLFHGVAGKYGLDAPTRIAPVVATFDCLMFPNRDRLRRYAEAGLTDPDGGNAALIGFPKVDCLVDGSLDRRAIERDLGLDPARATVMYAPTWSPYSSLNSAGREIIARLGRENVNLIVKLHDRSYDPSPRGSGGVDWRRELNAFARRYGIHVAESADASPYLFVSDAIITDHSSVGFEFMLLDRPIVAIDCPALIERASVNPDKVRLLRSAADVVADGAEAAVTALRALHRPDRLGGRRREIAADLFYGAGGATGRAVQRIYDLISLAAPARDELLAGRQPTMTGGRP